MLNMIIYEFCFSASSHELGQDYDHVTMLWERFKEFARETESTGNERVAIVSISCSL